MRLYPLIVASLISFNVYADLIPPSNNNIFYYHIGGGQNIPLPAFLSTNTVKLEVEGNIGLGYNCGVFNPTISITNSLNSIKNSFQNMSKTVTDNAKAAIAEFPMFIIARANPTLYNIFNNALLEARKDLEISTKSCEAMKNEIANHKNPYVDWATISMGDDWKYHMSLASNSSDINNSDINQVKNQIQKDEGKNGITWVQGSAIKGGLHAGGIGQAPIHVISDTTIAGYNVILQSGRAYDDSSSPFKTSENRHLVETWSSPKLAAQWLVNVVGDEEITTFDKGEKSVAPGIGLLPQTQSLTISIIQKLSDLVFNKEKITLKSLQDISAPRVMLNEDIIESLRRQPPLMQTILINKLSQEVSTAKVIDMALLARQILEEGGQVPAIASNYAAQEKITLALNRLDKNISNLLFNVKVNKELVSNTAAELLRASQSQQLAHTLIHSEEGGGHFEEGAVKLQGASR